MLKTIKYIFYFVFSIVALIIVIAIALTAFIKPNEFKPQISQAFYDVTGYRLTIRGDISWSFYPGFGLAVKNITLLNPQQKTDNNLATIKLLDIYVRIPPLIKGVLETRRLNIDGVQLNFQHSKQGISNWSINSAKPLNTHKAVQKNNDAKKLSSSTPIKFKISTINIKDARVVWTDEVLKKQILFEDLVLESHNVTLDKPFPVNIHSVIHSNQPQWSTSFHFASLVTVATKANATKQIGIRLQDLQLKLSDPNTKNLFNTVMTGQISVSALDKTHIDFNLSANQINLDRLQKTNNVANQPVEPYTVQPTKNNNEETIIPIDFIRNTNVTGQLHIHKLINQNTLIEDIRIALSIDNDILQLSPVTAKLYQGQSSTFFQIDARNEQIPLIRFNQHFTNINLAPLTKKYVASHELQLTGFGNVAVSLSTRGIKKHQLLSTLHGEANFSVKNGIFSLGLLDQIHKIAKLTNPTYALLSAQNKPIQFVDFGGSAKIYQGVLTSNDIKLISPLISLQGHGKANLITNELNFNLPTYLTPQGYEMFGRLIPQNVEIPLWVHGTITSPEPGVDIGKIGTGILKKKLLHTLVPVPTSTNDTHVAPTPADLLKEGLERILGF